LHQKKIIEGAHEELNQVLQQMIVVEWNSVEKFGEKIFLDFIRIVEQVSKWTGVREVTSGEEGLRKKLMELWADTDSLLVKVGQVCITFESSFSLIQRVCYAEISTKLLSCLSQLKNALLALDSDKEEMGKSQKGLKRKKQSNLKMSYLVNPSLPSLTVPSNYRLTFMRSVWSSTTFSDLIN